MSHFSPSSGSSYLNLSSLISSSPSLTTPTGEEPEVLPEQEVHLPELTSPGLSELLPDLPTARNGTNKPARPVSLSVGNSQPVLLPTSPLPRESPALPPLVRKLSSLPPPLVHIDCYHCTGVYILHIMAASALNISRRNWVCGFLVGQFEKLSRFEVFFI